MFLTKLYCSIIFSCSNSRQQKMWRTF